MSFLDSSDTHAASAAESPLPGSRSPAGIWAGIWSGIAGGIAVAVSLAVAPGADGILGAALAVLMVAIALSDSRHFIVPNALTAAALVLALVNAAVSADDGIVEALGSGLLRAAVTGGIFFALRAAYAALRDRQGIGLGDVKLAGVAGAWVGWTTIPMVIEIAALAAIGGYLFRQLSHGRPVRAAGRIPFGLYLAPAIWLGWLLEATMLTTGG
jgi:leader peptidase (prepilin peptidase)/N-methyltransferase